MCIYTNEFTFLFHVSDNVVNGNFCCCSCCSWNCDDRDRWLLGRCYTFQASYIFKFRIGNDDTDRFCCIHRRTAADSDQIISTGFLKCCYTSLYILNSWVWFDIRVDLICKTCIIQYICNFLCYAKFDQVWI